MEFCCNVVNQSVFVYPLIYSHLALFWASPVGRPTVDRDWRSDGVYCRYSSLSSVERLSPLPAWTLITGSGAFCSEPESCSGDRSASRFLLSLLALFHSLPPPVKGVILLSAVATTVLFFVSSLSVLFLCFSVKTITLEPLHSAWKFAERVPRQPLES